MQKSFPYTKWTFQLGILLPTLVIILLILDVSLGSVNIPLLQIVKALLGAETDKVSWQNIIWEFRMPKAFTAILAGATLAVSGLQMQTLFRNPLAGPYVLGISSGASLGVALVVLASYSLGSIFNTSLLGDWIVVLAASTGSGVVLMAVLALSLKVKDSMTLLIIGLMFGSLAGAIVSVLQFFSEAQQLQIYLIWTFGSLGGLDWNELYLLAVLCGLGLLIAFYLSKPLNTLLMGESYAQSMGINVKKVRILIVVSTSLMAGSVTAFCGPIAFIGLAVPHLTRILFNTANHKVLIPAVALSGMIIMLTCDIVSQLPGSQYILPINAITSLIGAPVVIWVILSKGGIKTSFSR
ncbi:iron ABC transporter permease [Fulvivirga sp. M361]|uniref:FecCD family ABC transporter permease n=1 Tax=Fulvivirga sp. M361 TaxID=2594266 RepID=UPI00117B50D6|nr:iron ABC transporter permease [Fulvivirga sp. M361]TRX55535.1 iron ABC transporter permease [Fulvivirga sp. M361]